MEGLVVCALMSVVLLVVYQLLFAGFRYVQFSEATVDAQQAALNAILQLSQELGESNAESYQAYSTPIQGTVFTTARDANHVFHYDTTTVKGSPLWQQVVCYAVRDVNGKPCLVRHSEPLGAPSDLPQTMVPARTPSYFNGATFRLIARQISSLQISGAYPVLIKVTSRVEEYGHLFQVEVDTKVYVKN